MDWKAILNPWSEARSLRTRNAYLEGCCDELAERARDAESLAFARAAEHYYQRTRMIEAQNEHLLKQLTEISSLTVPAPYIVLRDGQSLMSG